MIDLKQTDLSKRLRQTIERGIDANGMRTLLAQAADEIERYYTGMLNWKATAEAQSRTQPEATKPAQDLSAAILALPCDKRVDDFQAPLDCNLYVLGFIAAKDAAAALASSADALSAGDRVDAERYRHLRELMQFSTPPNKPTTMKLRAALPAPEHQPHRDWMGEHFDASVDRTVDADIRACLTAEEIPEFDASRAAIQAQKDGHG